jgi:hypothetical protein
MAAIIFEQIVETNAVQIVATDTQPMDFIVRVNGNKRHIREVIYQMSREALRIARGPLTA